MRLLVSGLLATSVLLTGCAESAAPGGESSQAPALDAKWRGTMTITPETATPDQQVALNFRSEKVRGIAFSLASRDEEGWTVAYYLTSDGGPSGSQSPGWWSVEDSENRGWEDIGIGGPGPDHVIVPDDAPAGVYLLCTENSADKACALLTVTN